MVLKIKCGWCKGDALYEKYHDSEWGVPLFDEQQLFEFLTLETFQAGLSWITKFSKNFINSENLLNQKELGTQRSLVAFELDERGIPRQGYDILNSQGDKIGEVTSGTMSPTLAKGIGMGYIPTNLKSVGTKLYIQIRKKIIPATIVKLPFYKGL